MKIWLLKARENLPIGHDMWAHPYDKCHGFVIRAENESQARRIADSVGGDENREVKDFRPWLSNVTSSCEELTEFNDEGCRAGVIMKDYYRA